MVDSKLKSLQQDAILVLFRISLDRLSLIGIKRKQRLQTFALNCITFINLTFRTVVFLNLNLSVTE